MRMWNLVKEKRAKALLCGFVAVVAASCCLRVFANAETIMVEKDINQPKVILLDAGHGGIDGGAVSRTGVLEKDINLIITKKLKVLLEQKQYKVLMVRETDTGLYTDDGTIRKKKIEDLENRLKMKKESKCDMYISIHLNIFPQSQYYGAQVWYGSNNESRKLAQIMQQNFKEHLDKTNNRKPKPSGNTYRILRDNGTTAAVIAECGFLTNVAEEEKLKTDEYQQKIAESIAKSVDMYYEGVLQ